MKSKIQTSGFIPLNFWGFRTSLPIWAHETFEPPKSQSLKFQNSGFGPLGFWGCFHCSLARAHQNLWTYNILKSNIHTFGFQHLRASFHLVPKFYLGLPPNGSTFEIWNFRISFPEFLCNFITMLQLVHPTSKWNLPWLNQSLHFLSVQGRVCPISHKGQNWITPLLHQTIRVTFIVFYILMFLYYLSFSTFQHCKHVNLAKPIKLFVTLMNESIQFCLYTFLILSLL